MSARINYRHIRKFLERLPIKNERKQIVPFRLRPAQEKFMRVLENLQDKRRPPRVIVVKSRRVGISRICTGLLFATAFWSTMPTCASSPTARNRRRTLWRVLR